MGIIILVIGGIDVFNFINDILTDRDIENQQIGASSILGSLVMAAEQCEVYPVQWIDSLTNETKERNLIPVECLR